MTIRDVARAAGVSISTVSRALSAPDQVKESTRQRVEDVARAMSYRPNRAARGLITGRTGSIALVVPDLENPFFGSVCKGAQARARASGYGLFIADTDEDRAVETETVRSLVRQVDGVILCSPRGTDAALRRVAADCTLVLINRRLDAIASIVFDNAAGIEAVLRHLMALGHRRIGYAAGPVTSWSDSERARAFREFPTTRAAGTAGRDLDLVELGNFPPYLSGGVSAGDLALASGVTAVVAFNDLVALGVIERLRQRGLSVPEDVSVTGFDDVSVATLASPHLTTVRLPRVQIGRVGVDLLLDTVLGTTDDATPVQDLPVELVVRQSTGVAASLSHSSQPGPPSAPHDSPAEAGTPAGPAHPPAALRG